MMNINNLYNKIETLLSYLKPSSDNDKNVIDLQKTFNSQNLDFNKDILPIIKKILHLPETFPNNILHSKEGHKYNELEFFQSNIISSGTNDTTATALDNSNTTSFFDKINKTQTKLGKHLLQSILLTPLHTPTDVQNILQNRQQVITNLMTNPNLDRIIIKLKDLANIEQDLLAILLPDTPEMQEVYKIIFFEFKPLQGFNYNETFQKIFCYFLIIFSPLYGIVSPFIFMFAPFFFLKYVLKVPITFTAFWQIIKNMVLGGTGFFANLNKIFNGGMGSVVEGMINQNGGNSGNGGSGISIKGVIFWLAKMIISFMSSPFGTYAYIGFIVISYLYGIYNSLQVSITYNKIINMFHSRLNIISKWLKDCITFYKLSLCFESNELAEIRRQIDQLLGHPTIRNLLEHKTFTHEPGIISNKGMIIKTFREFLDTKKTMHAFIEPFSHYLAYVDVMTATSSWLREGFGISRNFCTYICNTEKPIVKGSNIWNICCSVPVYNDILIGGFSIEDKETETIISKEDKEIKTETETETETESILECKENIISKEDTEIKITTETENILEDSENIPLEEKESNLEGTENISVESKEKIILKEVYNNMIITGPNGSGKSTYIKSIIECILLAQTIGVIPASQFELTPFKNITTYLNIPDCQGKESLFQAEMNRCHQQLQMLENAETNREFSFNIMDEIFVSTNYQEGMSGAYAVINQLCKFKNCLNIITTHFDVLANMNELKVDKQYFDIDIETLDIETLDKDGKKNKDVGEKLIKDYKIKPGVSKKHMALKLLKDKGFSADIIKDAEYLYEKIRNAK